MDKKLAGLVGAVSALATTTAVEAVRAQNVTEVLNPRSYAELLQPIQNAVALLMAADAVNAARPPPLPSPSPVLSSSSSSSSSSPPRHVLTIFILKADRSAAGTGLGRPTQRRYRTGD
jgi:hypothetical protein